jgi:hypothetical protein
LKGVASRLLVEQRATISHQHGVGLDHLPYLAAEKGQVGMAMLEGVRRSLDPDGLLNPGKLLPDRPPLQAGLAQRTGDGLSPDEPAAFEGKRGRDVEPGLA